MRLRKNEYIYKLKIKDKYRKLNKMKQKLEIRNNNRT